MKGEWTSYCGTALSARLSRCFQTCFSTLCDPAGLMYASSGTSAFCLCPVGQYLSVSGETRLAVSVCLVGHDFFECINRHVLLTDFLFSYNFYFVYFHFSIFYSTCSSCVWQLQLQKWNEMKWNECIISASLSINIVERDRSWYTLVAYPMCMSACVSVQKVYCDKTVDWIRMPFEVVSRVGRGMGVLDGIPRALRGGRFLGFSSPSVWMEYF